MIAVTSITNAIFTLLSSDSVLVSSDTHVCKYEIIDTSPNRSPFVDILRPSFQMEGRRMNINQPYMAQMSCPIFCSVMGTQDDQQTQVELDLLTDAVLTAINSGTNRTLNNTVNIILGYNVEPVDIQTAPDNNQDYFYANEITIIAEVFA